MGEIDTARAVPAELLERKILSLEAQVKRLEPHAANAKGLESTLAEMSGEIARLKNERQILLAEAAIRRDVVRNLDGQFLAETGDGRDRYAIAAAVAAAIAFSLPKGWVQNLAGSVAGHMAVEWLSRAIR